MVNGRRPHERPGRWSRTAWLVPGVAAVALLGACGPAEPADTGVAPLAGSPAGTRPEPAPSAPLTEPETSGAGPGEDPAPATPEDPSAAARATVDSVLDRYGAALTELAARPEAADDPASAASAAWRAVVVAGSALADDVTARIRARRADGVVVVPPPGSDRSWVHRALRVVPAVDRPEISFTWCGWSPGIGQRASDGVVVDDTVAHARGTGTVRLVDGGWRLAALDQTELVLLGPGSPDPCPAEVERARSTP